MNQPAQRRDHEARRAEPSLYNQADIRYSHRFILRWRSYFQLNLFKLILDCLEYGRNFKFYMVGEYLKTTTLAVVDIIIYNAFGGTYVKKSAIICDIIYNVLVPNLPTWIH